MLSGSRASSFNGVGKIPISEIKCCLELLEINNYHEKLEYIKWIQFLDSELIKEVEKEKNNGKT